MKKVLGLVIFLAVSVFSTTFSYAKDFEKISADGKIQISVLGTTTTISITNKSGDRGEYARGYIYIYPNRVDSGTVYADGEKGSIFSKKIEFIANGQTEKTVVKDLDISQNKTYYFAFQNGRVAIVPFSVLRYGIVKGDETPEGGYEITAFGDLEDQREMFAVFSKSPLFSDALSFPLGKFSGLSQANYGNVTATISVPPEKSGRYFFGLLAKSAGGAVDLILPQNLGNIEYIPSIVFGTNKTGEIFFNKDLIYKKEGTGTFSLSGSLDASKHSLTDLIPLDKITVSGEIYTPDGATVLYPLDPGKLDIASVGKYTLGVQGANLNAGEWYPVKILFESKVSDGGTGAKAEYQEKFNTDKGIIPQTGKERDAFFDRNSYRLLAPIPGLVALLDPALCQLEQQKNPGQICDINAFLNFILKLIIGLAAVVLVVRLIIEGYSYMITDTPFKKAAAKGDFKEALIGLVIALSSYLILNTINPRLVNNDVKIGVAEFEVDLAKDLGHANVVGTAEQLSSSMKDYEPFNITGEGVIVGDYQQGASSVRVINRIYPKEMEKGSIGKVKTIVLHNTMGNNPAAGWLEWAKPSNPSSCHFMIDKDGTIWQIARLTKGTACQTGDRGWGFTAGNAIGIEIVGCANNIKTGKNCVLYGNPPDLTIDPPTQQQIQSTIFLVNYLNDKFGTTLSSLLTTHGKSQYKGNNGNAKMPQEGQAIYDAIKDHIIRK